VVNKFLNKKGETIRDQDIININQNKYCISIGKLNKNS